MEKNINGEIMHDDQDDPKLKNINRAWLNNLQNKVSDIYDDVVQIKLIVGEIQNLRTLPAEVVTLNNVIKDLRDAILTAALGSDRVPMPIFNRIVATLCFAIIVLVVSFAGAQGWFAPLLHKLGI